MLFFAVTDKYKNIRFTLTRKLLMCCAVSVNPISFFLCFLLLDDYLLCGAIAHFDDVQSLLGLSQLVAL